MGNSVSSSTAMSVAPMWIRFFRMLTLTITAMRARLASIIRTFQMLLPMGRVNAIAIMQTPVTMRNIRSRRPIL